MRRAILAILLATATSALAGDGGPDRRIRYVTYDPDAVVPVDAVVGIVTHIVLEPGETYVTHAFGDGKAWDFAAKANHCFLKAVATNADSNLTIVTDRRSYHFSLRLLADAAAAPTFEIAFRYPDTEVRKRREDARRSAVEDSFKGNGEKPNLDYTMSGDLDLAPVNTWDDREFTYFKFPGQRDIPAIYMVDADGSESIVNRHTTGPSNEIVVVHKVAARWVLRLGSRALAIWNDAYDPEGRRNVSHTASPDVNRVIWR